MSSASTMQDGLGGQLSADSCNQSISIWVHTKFGSVRNENGRNNCGAQGWVDEDATFGKRVAGFFGFGKKKKAEGGSDEGKR